LDNVPEFKEFTRDPNGKLASLIALLKVTNKVLAPGPALGFTVLVLPVLEAVTSPVVGPQDFRTGIFIKSYALHMRERITTT